MPRKGPGMDDQQGRERLSEDESRVLTEELDREDALVQASRVRRRQQSYRTVLRIVAAVLLVSATTWAVTGAILPFWGDNTSPEGVARFSQRLREAYSAAQNVTYATVFALGGILIVTHLLGKLGPPTESND
jgi:hypothetical protein